MQGLIKLHHIDRAFTQGGNRLCFFDPNNNNRCIKIVRPDRTPELRRQQKSFPKNLKPLARFDENNNELIEIKRIEKAIGESAFDLIPRCFGMVKTDLGEGLCIEMIRDSDDKVSLSLKQYLWVNGLTESLKQALATFSHSWVKLGMPSRDLLLHNIVVQEVLDAEGKPSIKRLVVIDGLGWSGFSFMYYVFKSLARAKARKKVDKLEKAVDNLLMKKKTDADWGYHGWLNEEQRVPK